MKKVIIYGLGKNYYLGHDYLNKTYEIIGLTDTSSKAREFASQSALYRGEMIIEPDDILDFVGDDVFVIVTVAAEDIRNEIKAYLIERGVERRKIKYMPRMSSGEFLIDPMFFEADLSLEQKRVLFKNNVESVTIEVNSKCNRKCWFCPNSLLDRYSENKMMPDMLFQKIISELKEINYSEIITYSFYNEPLLDENLEDKIRFVKKMLPKCKQLITTNGDFLTEKRLDSLIDAGLDYLIVSVYGINDPAAEWCPDEAKKQNDFIIKRINMPISYESYRENVIETFGSKGNCYIRLQNYDFREVGHNRGEILPETLPLKKISRRHEVCCNSFVTFNIFFDGTVTACGNMRNDWKPHKDFMWGSVAKETIYDIYASDQARATRKNCINDINVSPCNSCSRNGRGSFIPIYPGAEILKRPRYQENDIESE